MMRALVVAALLVACGNNGKGKTQRPQTTGDAQGSAVQMNAGNFNRGPQVTPAAQLIAWLDSQKRAGEPRLVRLPLVLAKKGPKFSTVGARIGGAADAVTIYADDSKLGIGLADRARSQCKDSPTCAMWCEGFWRGEQDGEYTFEVIAVRDPISEAGLADASYAEVEGESGN